MNKDKLFEAFRICITDPKCRGCPISVSCNKNNVITIPKVLALDIIDLLKELIYKKEETNVKEISQKNIKE